MCVYACVHVSLVAPPSCRNHRTRAPPLLLSPPPPPEVQYRSSLHESSSHICHKSPHPLLGWSDKACTVHYQFSSLPDTHVAYIHKTLATFHSTITVDMPIAVQPQHSHHDIIDTVKMKCMWHCNPVPLCALPKYVRTYVPLLQTDWACLHFHSFVFCCNIFFITGSNKCCSSVHDLLARLLQWDAVFLVWRCSLTAPLLHFAIICFSDFRAGIR